MVLTAMLVLDSTATEDSRALLAEMTATRVAMAAKHSTAAQDRTTTIIPPPQATLDAMQV
jgi:hypothetical protein